MATLVLTTLVSAIGGPFGLLPGRVMDSIFPTKPRQGPRLSDLQVQTSRYGARIPRLYGAIRVAGTVIWSTDLKESIITSGGKGQPAVTQYSYSASFAVALSSRPIRAVGRIWADGNLLRGAAGDFKAPMAAFRLHQGSEGQPVDPLIASDVGIEQAPAYRGCAYALFDGLQLADFGNRIPSLTFEIFADDGASGVATIAADLARQAVTYAGDDPEPLLAGFAADGGDLREAVGALTGTYDLQWRERDGSVALAGGEWTGRALEAANEVRFVDGEAEPVGTKQRASIETVPVRLAIRHHDRERDFQLGIQTAERPGAGRRSEEVDLPAVLSAGDARQLADRRLRAALRGRTLLRRSVNWTALDLSVGDVVSLDDEPGRWLVEACDWEGLAVHLRLRSVTLGTRPAVAAGASGNPLLQQDLVQGATSLAIVELPPDGSRLADAPTVLAAATGPDAGWRRAAMFRYRAETESAEPIGRTAPAAVLGIATTILPDGTPWRIDRRSTVDVLLDNEADTLISVDDAVLLEDANLCQIGEEMLQFGQADPIGPGRYRLSRLLRGWHGTEWACGSHGSDERFVLLDRTRLSAVEVARSDVGQLLELRAVGSGDLIPAEATRSIDGRAMMPLSPVHGHVKATAGGDLEIGWVRRSRLGWAWADEGDAPLGEEMEAYRLRVVADGAVLREWETSAPTAIYAAVDHAADMGVSSSSLLALEIRQKGTWGLSRPLMLDLS